MEPSSKEKGPFYLVHFIQEWSSNFASFDFFFDNFSNCLVLHREGYFVIWEEHERQNKDQAPYSINLATMYKNLHACAIHPSKQCLAIQHTDNGLILLFIKENQAEEVKLVFPKAK